MRPRSIVILGPAFGQYAEMVTKGFRQNGLEADCFSYAQTEGLLQRLIWDYLPLVRLDSFRRAATKRIFERVLRACKDAALLIIIKAGVIPIDMYSEFVADVKCPIVYWMMDSVHRIEDGLEKAKLADMILSFEGTDSPILSSLCVPHQLVPLAVDPDLYFPISSSTPLWDLSFVGALYANRLSMLDSIFSVLQSNGGVRARVVGDYRYELHPFLTRRLLRLHPSVAPFLEHAVGWPHERINSLYNQSRICLNVFHPQSVESVNPRFFELGGSGAFQLCQANVAVGKYLDVGREVEVFETAEEAADKASFYLRNDTAARRIGDAGRRRVLSDHTYKIRIGQIVQALRRNGILQVRVPEASVLDSW